jgi:hypothetical protein
MDRRFLPVGESRAQTTDVRKVPWLSSSSILALKKGGASMIDMQRPYKSTGHLPNCLSHRPAPSVSCSWGFCQLEERKLFGE